MNKVINFSLISHPMNWVIVTLMILIVGIGVNQVMKYQQS